jgi:hypothetical protein
VQLTLWAELPIIRNYTYWKTEGCNFNATVSAVSQQRKTPWQPSNLCQTKTPIQSLWWQRDWYIRMHLPPGPSCMTSMPALPKFQRPSNCSTVHLYHRIRNTRSVSPWDTRMRFMLLERASGRWNRPTSMSDLSVSLNPAENPNLPFRSHLWNAVHTCSIYTKLCNFQMTIFLLILLPNS